MIQQPIISVIIPVKNEGKKIRSCIDGILSQTVKVYEIIVIDSGSTDETLQILAEFPIVKIIEIPSWEFNHGTTRNLGVAAAKGDYVLLTVGDAKAYNEFWIEELLKGFVDDEVVAVCGQQVVPHYYENNPMDWYMPVSKPVLNRVQYKGSPYFADLTPSDKHNACRLDDVTTLYLRDALIISPFKNITYGEDMLWSKEVLESEHSIVYNYEAKVFHYHLENAEYTFKITFTKCYFAFTQFGLLLDITTVTVLERIKLVYHLFMRIGIRPLSVKKWYKYNICNQNERNRAVMMFNMNVTRGAKYLAEMHSKYCGTPPVPVK